MIQDCIEAGTFEDLGIISEEVMSSDCLVAISSDDCGNFIVQKLLDKSSPGRRLECLSLLLAHILPLSTDFYGCRVIQKLIHILPADEQCKIVFQLVLEANVVDLATHESANYVMQKVIEVIPYQYLNFIVGFQGRVLDLSRDVNGSRVMQRCIRHLPIVWGRRKALVEELLPFAKVMIKDKLAKYVLQRLLECGGDDERRGLYQQMHGDFLEFSCHEHASTVCERALVYCDDDIRESLIEELMVSDGGRPVGLDRLMRDVYGSFVLNRAMEVAIGEQRSALRLAVGDLVERDANNSD
ncbi:ARM repeat-containing protein [Coprinopsis marcescibilis]|uniref:ARM repeat-containing protein n=1 Tax=Coprinopsis marcescibilis TaxID=230819 RepID=A0A5C3KDC0_COPMA|nr:ARM repeat-containing protein [Coprinopsis marcescibilis]